MRSSFVPAVLGLLATQAAPPALAEAEDRLMPAAYASLDFGGSRGAGSPRVGLRVASGAAIRAGAPALAQWELRPGGTELTVAGLPLAACRAPAAHDTEAASGRVERAVSYGVLGTALALGAVAWVLGEFAEAFGQSAGEAVVDGFEEGFTGGGGGQASCDGVKVGEECLGG